MLAAVSIIFSAFHLLISLFFASVDVEWRFFMLYDTQMKTAPI